MNSRYFVLDSKTHEFLKTPTGEEKSYISRTIANRYVDKLNLKHGSYRYYVVIKYREAGTGEEKEIKLG